VRGFAVDRASVNGQDWEWEQQQRSAAYPVGAASRRKRNISEEAGPKGRDHSCKQTGNWQLATDYGRRKCRWSSHLLLPRSLSQSGLPADPKSAASPTRAHSLLLPSLLSSRQQPNHKANSTGHNQHPLSVSRLTASAFGARFGPLSQSRLSALLPLVARLLCLRPPTSQSPR